MNLQPPQQALDLFRTWKREVDAAAAEAPLIGDVFATRWRVLRLDGEAMRLTDGKGESVEIAPDLTPEEARRAVSGLSSSGPLVLRLAGHQGFRRPARFPVSARAHLDNAVRLALPRLSPLPPDSVAFALERDALEETEGWLHLPVAMVRRDTLDAALERAAMLGLKINAVDLEGADPDAAPGFDLRPGKARPGAGRSAFMAGLALAGVLALAAAGFAADAALRLDPQTQALAPREAADPRTVAALAQRGAKTRAPAVAEVLEHLALRLPDNAYAQIISIEGATVQLTGLSWDVTTTLDALQDSPEFVQARTRGDTVPDPDSGRQRFGISVEHVGDRPGTSDAAADGEENS
jgi:Tfp pilus assembly protein PilN